MSNSTQILEATGANRAVRLIGYSHVAIVTPDIQAAHTFYCDVAGFKFAGTDMLPDCGTHVALTTASGHLLALCAQGTATPLPKTGNHQAFRVSLAARDEIVSRLAKNGVELHRYFEDRNAEQNDNYYFFDPFGNRLQLVVHGDKPSSPTLIEGIDHVGIQAIDVEWEEKFYIGHLGLPIDQVVGWRTADYVRAKQWGEGKEEMAPGARRWDKRYNIMHGKDPVPRPNAQLFVKTGDGTLGIYLADTHYQAPPEEDIVGVRRFAFSVRREDMERLAERLSDWGPTIGPVKHPASSPRSQSIYFRDSGANFIEFCC